MTDKDQIQSDDKPKTSVDNLHKLDTVCNETIGKIEAYLLKNGNPSISFCMDVKAFMDASRNFTDNRLVLDVKNESKVHKLVDSYAILVVAIRSMYINHQEAMGDIPPIISTNN